MRDFYGDNLTTMIDGIKMNITVSTFFTSSLLIYSIFPLGFSSYSLISQDVAFLELKDALNVLLTKVKNLPYELILEDTTAYVELGGASTN